MRRTIPILVILIGLLSLWGCSKKNPTQTGNLNQGQQAAFASEAQTYGVVATGFIGTFSDSLNNYAPGQPGTFNVQEPMRSPVDSAPPGWRGPQTNLHQTNAGNTWYWNHWDTTYQQQNQTNTVHDTVYVKFNPNIWDTAQHRPDTVKIQRVDWQALVNLTVAASNATTETKLDETANVGYASDGTDPSRTDGNFKIVGSVKTNGVQVASFTYQFGWQNCTRKGWRMIEIPHTCSGIINWSATSSYAFQNYNLSGTYTFTNGSGTGEVKYNNLVFAKFVFNPDGSGYYTLLSENWEKHHDFRW